MSDLSMNNTLFEEDFPEGALNIEITADKPFNQCFSCEFFRNGCSGPNLKATSIERECEFMQICRIQLGYTYQKVADLAGLSVTTAKRILSGQVKDPGVTTMRALNNVLVSDPRGKSPCATHLVSKRTEQAEAECARLQKLLDNFSTEHHADLEAAHLDDRTKIDYLKDRIEYLKTQIQFKEDQMRTKDKQLEERHAFIRRKDRIIAILGIALAIAIIFIFVLLIIDRTNPDLGFFWRGIQAAFSEDAASRAKSNFLCNLTPNTSGASAPLLKIL